MILVRDVFQLHFGKAKDAIAAIRKGASLFEGSSSTYRVLSDLTGPYYTLVLETTFTNLAEYEAMMQEETGRAEWQQWYAGFVPYLAGGHREIFTIVM